MPAHAMKARWGGGGCGIGLAALILNLKGEQWSTHDLFALTPTQIPSTLLIGGWVSAIVGLEVLKMGKYSCPLPGFEPGTVNPVP